MIACAIALAPTLRATAGAPVAPAATVPLHLEDSDSLAHFEVRDAEGHLLECTGHCDLTPRPGVYRVRVSHGGSVDGTTDATEVDLRAPTTLRGRPSDHDGVLVGVPLVVVGGLVTLLGGYTWVTAGMNDTWTNAQYSDRQSSGWMLMAGGALTSLCGVVFIASSHGSSITVESGIAPASPAALAAPIASLSLGARPTNGGGVFALSGTF